MSDTAEETSEKLVNPIMILWFINTPFIAARREAIDNDAASHLSSAVLFFSCVIAHVGKLVQK